MSFLWVAMGSALGGVLRYGVSLALAGSTFPLAVLLVNVSGSFAILFFAGTTGEGGRFPLSEAWRVFFMTGVCGGYTTFSAFSLQTIGLMQSGEWRMAGLNAALSLGLCLLGGAAGLAAAMAANAP